MTDKTLFYLDDYIEQKKTKETKPTNTINQMERFLRLCEEMKSYFNQEWEKEQGKRNSENTDQLLRIQKKAIIGYATEVNYFLSIIKEYLRKNGLQNEWFPDWYDTLSNAIFQENWGIAGIYAWKNRPDSSSAKIIGERIYYLLDGRLTMQPQTISHDRLMQLRKALLLRNPEKRMDDDYEEVYMLDGTRITIFDEGLAKEPTIIFRKYVVDQFTFEEQAERGTIPEEIIPMLKAKVKVGYNVCFIGPVRSGKTTFLETWQSYENPELEGIQIETDPEIPLHHLMPKSPVIQLVADGERLRRIIKPVLRGDADYLIMAEARDGVALKIALDVTKKGTRRVKSTFHSADPVDFCYDAAQEVVTEFGGELWPTVLKVAKGYHYLYEFVQLKNKSKKRLKGIYEIRYNAKTFEISIHQICKYDFAQDDWTFAYDMGEDKEEIGIQEEDEAFRSYRYHLKQLAEKKPMNEEHVTLPAYTKWMFR